VVLVPRLQPVRFEHRLYTGIASFSQDAQRNVTMEDKVGNLTAVSHITKGNISYQGFRVVNEVDAEEVLIFNKLPALV